MIQIFEWWRQYCSEKYWCNEVTTHEHKTYISVIILYVRKRFLNRILIPAILLNFYQMHQRRTLWRLSTCCQSLQWRSLQWRQSRHHWNMKTGIKRDKKTEKIEQNICYLKFCKQSFNDFSNCSQTRSWSPSDWINRIATVNCLISLDIFKLKINNFSPPFSYTSTNRQYYIACFIDRRTTWAASIDIMEHYAIIATLKFSNLNSCQTEKALILSKCFRYPK